MVASRSWALIPSLDTAVVTVVRLEPLSWSSGTYGEPEGACWMYT